MKKTNCLDCGVFIGDFRYNHCCRCRECGKLKKRQSVKRELIPKYCEMCKEELIMGVNCTHRHSYCKTCGNKRNKLSLKRVRDRRKLERKKVIAAIPNMLDEVTPNLSRDNHCIKCRTYNNPNNLTCWKCDALL